MIDTKHYSKSTTEKKMTKIAVLISLISIIILLVVGVLACHEEKGLITP